MAYDFKFHCIFCSKSFFQELQPILGFATARACPECLEKFRAEIAATAEHAAAGSEQDQ